MESNKIQAFFPKSSIGTLRYLISQCKLQILPPDNYLILPNAAFIVKFQLVSKSLTLTIPLNKVQVHTYII